MLPEWEVETGTQREGMSSSAFAMAGSFPVTTP